MADGIIVLDPAVFRVQFPAFPNPPYTDLALQVWFDTSTLYISDIDCGTMQGRFRARAIYLMMAHLMRLSQIIEEDDGTGVPGIVNSATIDKVTVSMQPPPVGDNWSFWLQATPYGRDLRAYLSMQSVGGMMIGGLPEVSAFRRVGGVFF